MTEIYHDLDMYKPYRGLNSTYGVIDHPMFKAILPSSTSELGAKRPERAEGERLWDGTVCLHICVIHTKMYVIESHREQRDNIMTDLYHDLDSLVTHTSMEI